jgi:hypothetical protein
LSLDEGFSGMRTLSGRVWSPADQPELGEYATLYPFAGFGHTSAVLTWPNSDRTRGARDLDSECSVVPVFRCRGRLCRIGGRAMKGTTRLPDLAKREIE